MRPQGHPGARPFETNSPSALVPAGPAARRSYRPIAEIGEAVAMLASEKLAYVTGLALVVDGGLTSTIMI